MDRRPLAFSARKFESEKEGLIALSHVRMIFAVKYFDEFRADPDNWKLGIFYFCRADRRLFVPKRMRGFGWTLNFARPMAWPALGLLVAFAYAAVMVPGAWGAAVDLRFMIKVLCVLGLIALCYYLSKPQARTH